MHWDHRVPRGGKRGQHGENGEADCDLAAGRLACHRRHGTHTRGGFIRPQSARRRAYWTATHSSSAASLPSGLLEPPSRFPNRILAWKCCSKSHSPWSQVWTTHVLVDERSNFATW